MRFHILALSSMYGYEVTRKLKINWRDQRTQKYGNRLLSITNLMHESLFYNNMYVTL